MDVPNINRTDNQLIDIDEDFLNLMTSEGGTKDDVSCLEGELEIRHRADFKYGKDLIVTIFDCNG